MLFHVTETKDNTWETMAELQCHNWTGATWEAFDSFLKTIAKHVKQQGHTLEFRVTDVHKGVSLKGAAKNDFVWVSYLHNGFSAQITDNARKINQDFVPLRNITHAGAYDWQNLANAVIAAHDFVHQHFGDNRRPPLAANCNSILEWKKSGNKKVELDNPKQRKKGKSAENKGVREHVLNIAATLPVSKKLTPVPIKIPRLRPVSRHREFDSYSADLRAQVVRGWLFSMGTHRELDESVLGLNPLVSKGYQSMGILHYLGLSAAFHGLFKGVSANEALAALENDQQDFGQVLAYLRNNSGDVATSLQALIADEKVAVQQSRMDSSAARLNRINAAPKYPLRVRVYSYAYKRNPDIVAEALCRANGICEVCKKQAPFIRASDGDPYLEVHHLIPLAEGGLDSLENVVALCPNCHRQKHFG